MRPEPPDLTQAASKWNDAELFWIMQHGIKMTGMPAFGPTHTEHELWAMVAFNRRLPQMSRSEFEELTAATTESGGHHSGEGGQAGYRAGGGAGGGGERPGAEADGHCGDPASGAGGTSGTQ